MLAGCLAGMTRAEMWRNEWNIRRLDRLQAEQVQGTEREPNKEPRPATSTDGAGVKTALNTDAE
jgi:hypothetical protein